MHYFIERHPKKVLLFLVVVLLFAAIVAIIDLKREEAANPVAALRVGDRAPLLVIDAGHGGLDGGAVSGNGTAESGINLSVALKVQALSRLFGREPVMTRCTEMLDYPDQGASIHSKKLWDQKRRVELINSTPGAVLLSIHQNTFPDRRPSGTQVLYGREDGSQQFGAIAHDNLIAALCPENRRVLAPISDQIYLMKQVHCPAILVECGFLSNPAEAEQLCKDSYQLSLATVLYASYLQYTSDSPEETEDERENQVFLYGMRQ